MTTPVRVPGVPGRRPPKNAPALRLGGFLTGKVPAHPAAVDYLAALGGGWDMRGNDRAGCCVSVTWANVRRLVTATLTGAPSYPSQDEVWALYKTQNPEFDPSGSPGANGPGSPCDQGMDVQTALEYLTATGGPDGVKAVAFAKVNHNDADEVKAAIAIFGYVWTGVLVAENNQQEFSAGQPWDYDPDSPQEGGHSIITGGYGQPGSGPLGGDERFITWAAETSFTDAFWAQSVEECWAVIWPEHLGSREFIQGIDAAALAADYKAITGRRLPAPPAPSPVTKGGKGMFQAIEQKLEQVWHRVSGEVEADLREALDAAKQEEARILPLVEAFGKQIGEKVLADLAPEAKALAEQLLAQLLAELGVVLGKAPEPPAA